MTPVKPPEEWSETSIVSTDDIPSLPKGSDLEAQWREQYKRHSESCVVEEKSGLSVQESAFTMDQFGAEMISFNDEAFVGYDPLD